MAKEGRVPIDQFLAEAKQKSTVKSEIWDEAQKLIERGDRRKRLEELNNKVGGRYVDSIEDDGEKAFLSGTISFLKSSIEIEASQGTSMKLQYQTPQASYRLVNYWADATGASVGQLALQALERGLQSMRADGTIPKEATEKYQRFCSKLIALKEIKSVWDDIFFMLETNPKSLQIPTTK